MKFSWKVFSVTYIGMLAAIGPVLKILSLIAGALSIVTSALAVVTSGATATSAGALLLSKIFTGLGVVCGVVKGAIIAVAGALGLPIAGVVAIGVAIAGLVLLIINYWEEIKEATRVLGEFLPNQKLISEKQSEHNRL